jgi:NAD(P)-dependent dehydrogenase (short-subunit alcohol dehydrogenase family)
MAHSDTLFDLTGTTAVVTGTASGLGVLCARILAQRGAHQGLASPCRIAGRSSGAVGISSAEAVSHVDTVPPIADYSGPDTAVSAGPLLAGSGDVAPRQPPPNTVRLKICKVELFDAIGSYGRRLRPHWPSH